MLRRAAARRAAAEVAELLRTRKEAAKAQEEAAAVRRALAEFLGAVASACADRAVVQGIEGRNLAVRLSAKSLSAEDATRALQRLDELATPKGWRVENVQFDDSAGFSCECRYLAGGEEIQ